MTEAIIIVVSSSAGAFIVWFFSKKTEQVAVDNSDEVVELKVKIAKLEQQIVDLSLIHI